MSASGKIPAKHVLRGILRSLRVNTAEFPAVQRQQQQQQQQQGLRSTMKYVLERYRSNQELRKESNDATSAAAANANTVRDRELRKMAYEYMILRRDIDERSQLQKLDTGAENQLSPLEMSRRAAARAGLQLPKLDPDAPK
eukprot:CAMPEP_0197175002 /NCGR_PEP_ID=MMETSP1423-20130617/1337_1 /TAXON_ID=476441 /ORGANISM="Pseudo-nitzschia heimii, Strain UNC1101" /LENGTH=140 /DNA_ID=CAMNT_0042624039 /DNA_START=166 /DNA_END=588 /DNA_ORIENTATION=-